MTRLTFSRHARERMAEMDVDDDEVVRTIADPTMTWPDGTSRVYAGDRLVVIVAESRVVVTVSWNRPGVTFTDRATGRGGDPR